MTRWAGICKLVSVSESLDPAGNPVEELSERTAYCNEISIGLSTWGDARAAGLTADARLQLREEAYAGEQRVVYKGAEYEVEQTGSANGFATLTLRRLASNGGGDGE